VVQKNQKMQALKELPLLADTPLQKREALFKQKLQLCCVIFNFDDADSDTKGKEIKRETLVELAEYVNTPVGQKIFVEGLMPDIVELVRANIFRTLPPQAVNYIVTFPHTFAHALRCCIITAIIPLY
jgi:serine/threonine-protein phosphatase 2A regulatory subunit B'